MAETLRQAIDATTPAILRARGSLKWTAPGPAFGSGGPGAFRLNFATPQPILTEMVEHIAAALNLGS